MCYHIISGAVSIFYSNVDNTTAASPSLRAFSPAIRIKYDGTFCGGGTRRHAKPLGIF